PTGGALGANTPSHKQQPLKKSDKVFSSRETHAITDDISTRVRAEKGVTSEDLWREKRMKEEAKAARFLARSRSDKLAFAAHQLAEATLRMARDAAELPVEEQATVKK